MSQPYLSLEAEFHDPFWAVDDDASEARLMRDFLKSHPGTALEIGSGSGRLLIPLLLHGHSVEGLELSADMIRLAREKAGALSLDATLHHGDMSSWTAPRKYSAVLAPAFTLQLSTDPAATLLHWQSFLQPGGGLYLTTFIPFAELEGDLEAGVWFSDHQATLPSGRVARLDTFHEIDPKTQILDRRHRYYYADAPNLIHESRQLLRWFTLRQLSRLLHNSGYHVLSSFADFDPERSVTCSETEDFDGIMTFLATSRPE